MPRLATLLLLALALPAAQTRELVDHVVRYVDGQPITLQQMWERVRVIDEMLRRQGQTLEGDARQVSNQLMRRAREELTDEMLLEQECLKLKLPIDERRMRRDIQEDVLQRDRFPRLDQQVDEIMLRRRMLRIDTVVRFFAMRLPAVSPEDLRALYEAEIDRYRRPARAQVWRILERPASAEVYVALRKDLAAAVFQRLSTDRQLAPLTTVDDAMRTAYREENDDAGACALLMKPVAEVLAVPAPPDLGPRATDLREELTAIQERWTACRSAAEITAGLEQLAATLRAEPDPAARLALFQAAARTRSILPREAEQGGEVGLVEAGKLGQPYDGLAFSLPLHEPSAVTPVGDGFALVLVSERTPAVQEELATVSAALRSRLDSERRDSVRRILVQRLRSQAALTDTKTLELDELLEQAAEEPPDQQAPPEQPAPAGPAEKP